jgi:hypothetical protein
MIDYQKIALDIKYYSFRTKYCNHCQGENEDEDHILRCLSISRSKSQEAWLRYILEYLSEAHTPPSVKKSIIFYFHKWIKSLEINETVINGDTSLFSKAIHQQHDIGWTHFVRGRLSIEWGNIVQTHLEKHQIKNMSAEKWGSDLIFINWKHIFKIWRERWEENHGTTPEQIEKSSKTRLLEEIWHIQMINADLANSDHSWILEDIEALSDYNSKMLEAWLYSAKIIALNMTRSIGINLQSIHAK